MKIKNLPSTVGQLASNVKKRLESPLMQVGVTVALVVTTLSPPKVPRILAD
jgi:hypothetical protein